MVQLHVRRAKLDTGRPTTDVDVLLHIETDRITVTTATAVLRSLGYVPVDPLDPGGKQHRFLREHEVVDVMIADHVAPSRLPRQSMVKVPGGTRALQRTVDCTVQCVDGTPVTILVPDVLGALTLKGGAYREDSRDRDRHLEDAVLLFATVEDAAAVKGQLRGSDGKRLRSVAEALRQTDHPAWSMLRRAQRDRAYHVMTEITAPPR